jgi:glycosyltransferase involved in cell wall biosynthesis
MLVGRAHGLRRPLVYTAIGLPERLGQLGSERLRRLYARALTDCAAIVAYSAREADDIARWVETHGGRAAVEFVPFGVDTDAFRPSDGPIVHDVVSVGADPHRDFALLLEVARTMPTVDFTVVATGDGARTLSDVPPNVTIEIDLPFERMRERLAAARVVALPVRENTYSGATTVLLQSLALGKPVVVGRTSAIATDYGLVDGENCRLVQPGDAGGFAKSLADVLRDDSHARALGGAGRRTVERELTWGRYVSRLEAILVAAGASARVDSGRA